MRSFEEAWSWADTVPGWLTAEQGRLLWHEARSLPHRPTILEIGSHQGRSTIVLATAAAVHGGHVIAVDPFVEGRLFGGASTKERFRANVAAAGVAEFVELVEEYSTELRPHWQRPLDYLYIDGKHDYWTLSDDLRWYVHLPAGAPVLVHDCFSSIGVTLGILRHVLFGSRLRYEQRVGSLALFRVRPPTWRDRLRIVQELPWWLRNIFLKTLLRVRLRPLARAFGHQGPYDPY